MTPNITPSRRYHVVDALRGFAIVSIMLLHNIEHFDYYFRPEGLPQWMVSLDKGIWDTLFFLFGGKSYGIFALLFGLTFFIQMNNQEKKGRDFRGRFAWRLVLLFAFGMINSTFYQGDILTLYAAVGFLIIPFAKLDNKVVFFVAILLLLQPVGLYHLFNAIQHPEIAIPNPKSWAYFGNMQDYIQGDSMSATLWGNLTNGKKAVVLWSWENGRYFHMLALFLLGMLMGRKKLFASTVENTRFWAKTLIISAVSFIVLFVIQKNAGHFLSAETVKRTFLAVEGSWTNIAFMFILISGFFLLFQNRFGSKILGVFTPMGKMSLSNYVFQSIIGSSIYYGYGLAMYQYTGSTYCILIGIALSFCMGTFSLYWTRRFRHGPLEYLWHQATWITLPSKKPGAEAALEV